MHDLVIRGGLVVDGTGAEATSADVALQDGTIARVGRVGEKGRQEIDADGAIVTPGFVDIHTHFDGQVNWDPELSPSSWHGVTTAVMGNCGVGFAPVRPGQEGYLAKLMESVEDIPAADLEAGVPFCWESFPEYLDAIEKLPLAIDVATQVPHCALRVYVMGERGVHNERATPEQAAEMGRLVKQGIQAGALGFSTSRTLVHRAPNGEPVPGTFADEAELRAIALAMGEIGAGVFGVAGHGAGGEDFEAPMRELEMLERLSKESGRPFSFILLQVDGKPGLWRELLDATERARASGAQLTPQVHVRGVGLLMSFASNLNPFILRPSYQKLAGLPIQERIARLRDPAVRSEILADNVEMEPLAREVLTSYERIFPLGDPPRYEPEQGDSIAAKASRFGLTPEAVLYDAMLENDGRAFLLRPTQNYSEYSLDPAYAMLTHPNTVVGLADGGAHCAQTCDTSSPTFMLTHWVRDRTRGERIPLEHAVKSLTADTAALYGLGDRGVIAPGMRADLNVIDHARLQIGAPRLVADFPAGGSRLVQDASGYLATIVSGEIIRRNDKATGIRSGRLVRGARTT